MLPHHAEAEARVGAILANEAWDTLAGQYSVVLPQDDPRERSRVLCELSANNWDVRGQQQARKDAEKKEDNEKPEESKQVERSEVDIKGELAALNQPDSVRGAVILKEADNLGMIKSKAADKNQAGRLVLGAAVRSCFQRSALGLGYKVPELKGGVIELVRTDNPAPDEKIFAIGVAGRLLDANRAKGETTERDLAAQFMPEHEQANRDSWTEADIMRGSMAYILGTDGSRVSIGERREVANVGYEAQGPGYVTEISTDQTTVFCLDAPNPVHPKRTNRQQAIAAGVSPENIDMSPICTYESPDWPSYERDRPGPRAMYRFPLIVGLGSVEL